MSGSSLMNEVNASMCMLHYCRYAIGLLLVEIFHSAGQFCNMFCLHSA